MTLARRRAADRCAHSHPRSLCTGRHAGAPRRRLEHGVTRASKRAGARNLGSEQTFASGLGPIFVRSPRALVESHRRAGRRSFSSGDASTTSAAECAAGSTSACGGSACRMAMWPVDVTRGWGCGRARNTVSPPFAAGAPVHTRSEDPFAIRAREWLRACGRRIEHERADEPTRDERRVQRRELFGVEQRKRRCEEAIAVV